MTNLEVVLSGAGSLQSQVYVALRDAILSGRLPAGRRLPSTRELAVSLAVSRMTTLTAYERLHAEGYVVTERGRGTFVSSAIVPNTTRRTANRRHGGVSKLARRLSGLRIPAPDPGGPPEFDFGHGRVCADAAFERAWARSVRAASKRSPRGYPDPLGLPALRDQLRGYLERRNRIRCGAEQILITNGTQQALQLIARVLVDPGDRVAVEDPGYPSARWVFQQAGAHLEYLPVDRLGARVSELDVEGDGCRLCYVTPAHQFPLGGVLPPDRRLDLLERAAKGRCWIVEDDYDGEFRHEGPPVESLSSLDRRESVLPVGSLSKTIDPRLRLGYLIVPSSLVRVFSLARALEDHGSATLQQQALASVIDNGEYERHVARVRRILADRRATLLEECARRFGGSAEVLGAATGSFVVLRFSGLSPASGARIRQCARLRGVRVDDASSLFRRRRATAACLMLGYGGIDGGRIAAGLQQLARAVAA